jgi:hypothetical protein
MLIRVDFPAPFSPMIPWIVPGATLMEMSLFAWTGPKALEMPLSSIAGVMRAPLCPRNRSIARHGDQQTAKAQIGVLM